MNSEQAKKIDLPDLLSRLGYEPVKVTKGGRELWYQSPFRNEKEPSFHTSFLGGKWIWNDFGDAGGNVVDFVMRHQGIQFKEALSFLRNLYQGSLFEHSGRTEELSRKPSSLVSFQQQNERGEVAPEEQRELEFLEAHEIRNPAILEYLEKQRKIPADLAKLYLKEVQYRNKTRNKVFFAFGMENESGGYEIRVASDRYKFKSALIKRDITVIKDSKSERNLVSVFEGMTDFLSLLVMQKTNRLLGDAIIMHSVSTYNRTTQYIVGQGYERIFTFLDNDETGRKNTTKFEGFFGQKVFPQSSFFSPYNDLNNALIGNMRLESAHETLAPYN